MTNSIIVRGSYADNAQLTRVFSRAISTAVNSVMNDVKEVVITFRNTVSEIEIEIERYEHRTRTQKIIRVGQEYSEAVTQIANTRLNNELKARIIDKLETSFERYVEGILPKG